MSRRSRWQLGFASAAVLLAAADTYVVVVVLPSVMSGVGLGIDSLARATPIVSGFLLGYVAMLPLLGRLSDLVGREPVFVACTAIFGLGSLLTATAHALPVLVTGRAMQGLGGGGLVPVTLALVAARWPIERRGLPLGVVGAVQELGSVIGPLYGTAVVEVGSWRTIFWINLPLAAFLGLAFSRSRERAAISGGTATATRASTTRTASGRPVRLPAISLAAVGFAPFALGLDAPAFLANRIDIGQAFTPMVGGASWAELSSPLTATGALLISLAIAIAAIGGLRRPRGSDHLGLGAAVRQADLPSALLLAVVLGCVVVAFSTADPTHQVVASSAPVAAVIAVVAIIGLLARQRSAAFPLLEPRMLANKTSAGALAVNLVIGAGLIAALVDVPLFARATVSGSSQVQAAVVLLRFLVAVPVGALVGGLLIRHARFGAWVAGAGSALAAVSFGEMASWGENALSTPLRIAGGSIGIGASDVDLILCGLGFGLVIAPVNAAVLFAVPSRLHGLASSLAVVARTVGMLVGLSVLTAVGIRRFSEAESRIGSPFRLCPSHPGSCPAFDRASTAALLRELHTIFAGAAVCTGLAAVLAVLLLRKAPGVSAGGVSTTMTSALRPSSG